MKFFLFLNVRCLVIFVILIYYCNSLPPETRRHYKHLISGQGLYTNEDKIVLLNVTNFKTTLFGTKNAWLVEFYNSWCGHCHKFAPTWKSLAANLYGWSSVVKLAALDCSNDDNNPVCRDYEIMAYPTLKFFSAHAPLSNQGVELIKDPREDEVRRGLVGVLLKEQAEGRGQYWPNITPYRNSDVSSLWRESGQDGPIRYVFLIFEEDTSSLATEVILDLSVLQGVHVRSVLADNEVMTRLMSVHTYPSLVLIEPDKSEPVRLHPEQLTREAFRQTIKSYVEAKGLTVPEEPPSLPIIDEPLPNLEELMKAREDEKHLQNIKKLGDVVFLVDLENAVRYSLQHELTSRKLISGDAFEALNNYLSVLAKYFPVGESGISFLQNLRDTVFQEKEIRGLRLKSLTSGLDSVLSTSETWMGCRGSEPHLRGYPCGLWTLFHYMTVSAMRDSQHVHFDPLEVLQAMLGYITYFFGCTGCSKHFQEMANRSMKAKVTDARQAVLWLWTAHNEVSSRLAGDASEDPEFPKIQFPSPERCSKCRDSAARWDEESVLKYLTNLYHQDNLNYLGSNTKLYSPNESDLLGRSPQQLTQDGTVPHRSGKEFNFFDMSLCVTLYVVCGVICMGVCLKFIIRKRYKKKAYIHDLQGKV